VPRRADVLVAQALAAVQWNGAGTNYIVQTPGGTLYLVYVDTGSDVAFKKSTDGGLTWSAPTVVFAGTVTNLSVWYDRWSNISAGLIHIAYTESATDDTLYRTIDTESADALSTQTVIFAGGTTATGGHLSITRAVGGNVYCKTVIDAGAEGGFFRLPNANVPNGAWDAARTVDETIATTDMMILLPDYDAADTQDIMAIFWDASANEVSRKLHDDSGNTWSETSIATSMTDSPATTAFPHFAVAMDIANTRHYLVAWSAVDAASARLRAWTVDSGAITALTDVVSSSTDDQGLCAISLNINTGELVVFYAGATAGGETFPSALNIYCKGSSDGGATWGPETKVSAMASAQAVKWLATIPRVYSGPRIPPVAWFNDIALDEILCNVERAVPRASHQLVGG
jgi:hypothetical protein